MHAWLMPCSGRTMANHNDYSQLTLWPSLHSSVEHSNIPKQEYGLSRSDCVFPVKGNYIKIGSFKYCSQPSDTIYLSRCFFLWVSDITLNPITESGEEALDYSDDEDSERKNKMKN